MARYLQKESEEISDGVECISSGDSGRKGRTCGGQMCQRRQRRGRSQVG